MNLLLKDAIILSLFGTNINKYNNQTNAFINIQEYDTMSPYNHQMIGSRALTNNLPLALVPINIGSKPQ